jgi:hypothetical protein
MSMSNFHILERACRFRGFKVPLEPVNSSEVYGLMGLLTFRVSLGKS